METRKVQQVGYSTLAVSLPKNWADEVGLKRGDEVTLIREGDGSLRIFPGIERNGQESLISVINADFCDERNLLTRIITGSYIIGCDVFQIVSKKELTPEHLEEIRNTVGRLTGINIVEQTADQVTIQSFVDPNKFPVEGLIRRLHVIASSMQLATTRALFENKPWLTKEVLLMEEETDRIYWLILRQIILSQLGKSIVEKPSHLVSDRLIAKCIEAIADYASDMAREVSQIKEEDHSNYQEIMEKIFELSEIVHTISKKSVKALFKTDIKLANFVIEQTKLAIEKEKKLSKNLIMKVTKVKLATSLRSIIWSLRQISRYSKLIAEIAINRGLNTPSKICKIETFKTSA